MARWGWLSWVAITVVVYGVLAWVRFVLIPEPERLGLGTRALTVSVAALSLGILVAGTRALFVGWDNRAQDIGCMTGIVSLVLIVAGWAALSVWGPG